MASLGDGALTTPRCHQRCDELRDKGQRPFDSPGKIPAGLILDYGDVLSMIDKHDVAAASEDVGYSRHLNSKRYVKAVHRHAGG